MAVNKEKVPLEHRFDVLYLHPKEHDAARTGEISQCGLHLRQHHGELGLGEDQLGTGEVHLLHCGAQSLGVLLRNNDGDAKNTSTLELDRQTMSGNDE